MTFLRLTLLVLLATVPRSPSALAQAESHAPAGDTPTYTEPAPDTAVAPPPTTRPGDPALAAGVSVRRDAEGRPVLTDALHGCALTMPGPYWEVRTRDDFAAEAREQAGACSGPAQVPDGFVAECQNKDAMSVVRLEVLPERFLVRDRGDIEDYVNRHVNSLRSQIKAPLSSPDEPTFDMEGAVIRHRSVFLVGDQEERTKVVIYLFFVRPADEAVKVYRLICGGLEKDFGYEEPDYVSIADSFRFTGETDAEFFVPGAAVERLPRNLQPPAAPSQCGDPASIGMMLAIAGVMITYGFMRKKLRGQGGRRSGPRL